MHFLPVVPIGTAHSTVEWLVAAAVAVATVVAAAEAAAAVAVAAVVVVVVPKSVLWDSM